MMRLPGQDEWRVVYGAAVLLVLGFFLFRVQAVLSPIVLFLLFLLLAVPYAGTRLHRLVVIGTSVLAALWLLRTTGFLLAPFILAMVLAYILDPAVDVLERRRVPRGRAVLLHAQPRVGGGAGGRGGGGPLGGGRRGGPGAPPAARPTTGMPGRNTNPSPRTTIAVGAGSSSGSAAPAGAAASNDKAINICTTPSCLVIHRTGSVRTSGGHPRRRSGRYRRGRESESPSPNIDRSCCWSDSLHRQSATGSR